MDSTVFEEPVSIFVGLSFPTRVENVAEAYAILAEWPLNQRGPAHKSALNACKAAMAGLIDAETARGMFVAFARKCGILMPETEPVIAASRTGAFGQQFAG